jgi:hypothetical protein
MFPWYPQQPLQDPVTMIKDMTRNLEALKDYAKTMEKKEKEEKEKKKFLKLPSFSLIETTMLIFVFSPIFGLILGPMWAKVFGFH